MRSILPIFILFINILNTYGDTERIVGGTASSPDKTLKVAQVLFRHGARNVDRSYPGDPYQDESLWEGGFQQLTCLGKTQAYELGHYLRRRYEGFINESYVPKEIHVQSSDLDRTIQTAYSVIAGFYPPNKFIEESHENCELIQWKPVPVHSTPIHLDRVLRQAQMNCPRFLSLQKEFHGNSDVMKEILGRNKELISFFAKNAKVHLHSTTEFGKYYDTLAIQNYYNLTLPEWAEKILGSKEAASLAFFEFELLTYTDEMKRFQAGPLIQQLITNFNEGLNLSHEVDKDVQIVPRKLYLMSGHDLTLSVLLNTLGLYESGTQPSFSAALIIELYGQDGESPQDFILQLSYRNEKEESPKILDIPQCPSPCKYGTFEEIVQQFIPEDWEVECQSTPQSLATSSNELIIWMTIGISVGVVLIIAYLLLRSSKRRTQNTYVSF